MTTILPTDVDIEQPQLKESEDTTVPDRPILMKSISEQFLPSPWIKQWLGCDFPLVPNEVIEEYHKHHLYSVNPFIFIPSLTLLLAFLFFRSGLIVGLREIRDSSSTDHEPVLPIIAVVCVIVNIIFFGLYLAIHALRLTKRDVMLADLTSRLKYLPFRLEESVFSLAICSWSLFLISRVLNGQCPIETSLWEQQTCNPFASQGGIPTELAYGLYMIPLVLQMAMKNISIRTLVIGHLTTLSVVLFCICYTQAWNEYFIVFNWILSSNVSFEVKRAHRVSYKKLMIAQEQQALAMLRTQQIELMKQEQERAKQEQVMRELAEETKRTSEALKTKCSLVRHIGHEIRTPLNVVGVGVDMLIKELEPHIAVLPDGMMDIVHGIQEASTASLEVINELLMFEKLAAGMTTLECVPTLILPFLEQAMKQHLLPALSKEIAFELVPSSVVTHDLAIHVDPLKLATVFRNLFSNAIKFTKKHGRVTVRIDIKTIEGVDMVEVTVQDSGAGLSAENLSRLFGEGVQFNANGLQGGGGSGLGLFITKGIVELHKHGKIWAESEGEGFGCTFFVHLPLHSFHYVPTGYTKRGSMELPASTLPLLLTTPMTSPQMASTRKFLYGSNGSSEHADTKTKQLSVSSGSENGSNDETITEHSKDCRGSIVLPLNSSVVVSVDPWKPTILVVDDSKMNRKMLVRMLISKGFTCREAEDGMEGLSEMTRLSKNKSTRMSFNMFSGMLSHHHTPRDPDEALSKPKSNSKVNSFRMPLVNQPSDNQEQHFAIDAVLIDFNMPRMNGPDAIKEMRKMGFRGPIIGVSGGEEETMTQFLAAGADDVLQKPAKTDQLVTMLLRGFEQVIDEEMRTNDETKSVGGSDDGMDHKIPISRLKTARKERIAQLRQFLDEGLASTAKKRSTMSPMTTSP